jgi:hypothetical protein
LLLDVITLYKQERQIYNSVAKLQFDPNFNSNRTPFRLPLPDVRRSLSEFLSCFDQFFLQRITLTPEKWLGVFYAIVIFSMAKSLLIDTLSLRDDQETPTPWRASDAIQIGSVYKAVVSVFTWSAKINTWCPSIPAKGRDPLMTDWTSIERENIYPISSRMRDAFTATQKLTRQASWHHGTIKSSKDFLMSLGTGDFLDMGFSGFLPQRYGSKTYRKVYPETTRTRNPMDGQSAVRDSALVPPYPAIDIDSTNATTSTAATALPMTASKSVGLCSSSELVVAGNGRYPTFPQASFATNAISLYPEADSGKARQAAASVHRRNVPYSKHHNTVNVPILDHGEASRYYSAPSRTTTGPLSNPYPWDNPNEVTNPHMHNQEQTENIRGSENASENNDQGSAKRVCNPVEETIRQRGDSVMMEMDSDVTCTVAESHGLASSTGVFSTQDRSTTPRPIRKTLSKEQREHAAKVRKSGGACAACKKRKSKVR